MRYAIANFKKEIPNIEGMKHIVSHDMYQIYSFADDAWDKFPEGQFREEITEIEGTVAWKFYGEVRPYRSAYSDVEGLEPDPESLEQGKRKTKVHFNWDIYNAVVLLMKRIFKRQVIDIFDTREDRTKEQEILDMIDGLNTIREICYEKERLLGIEMSKTQLKELYLWDDETDSRKGRHHFLLGF